MVIVRRGAAVVSPAVVLAVVMLIGILAGCQPAKTRARNSEPSQVAPAASAPSGSGSTAPTSRTTVTFDGAPTLVVEVAATPKQRETGLMNRTEVPAGTGMLFVFPGPTTGGFWMKNTLVPLSIAYIDGDKVVSTAEMVPCPQATKTCPTYPAAAPYTSAVEAAAGFFPANGIGPGTRVSVAGPTTVP